MEFISSPTNKPTRVILGSTGLTRRSTYGTPRIVAKPFTPRIGSMPNMNNDNLTFLSPQLGSSVMRNMIIGSPRLNVNQWLTPSTNATEEKRGTKRRMVNVDNNEKATCLNISSGVSFPQSNTKRRRNTMLIRDPPNITLQLEKTYAMIDRWQKQMYQLQTKDWENKRKYWLKQCHETLWKVLKDPALMEIPQSEMFPKTLLPINKLTSSDKHWLKVLVNSAVVQSIKSPDFAELIHDPQNKSKPSEEEFEFQIKFQFGFDIKDIEWYIHSAVGSTGVNHFICGIIAEYVGHSKFICDVQIYYKKLATPWWEQDGIAKMKYWSGEEYIDMIDFSPEAEVYSVQDWPVNSMVIDDYSEIDIGDIQQSEEDQNTSQLVMERKFITSVCCQIIHICMCKTAAPQSCAARNVLKQLSMILKGWFIGVLLGEGIFPDKVVFEYDTRAPCLAPVKSGSEGGAQG